MVLSAVGVRQELLNRLADAVGALHPSPVHASVFGSFARGDGDEDSDIDLLMVLPPGADQDPGWEPQMRDLEDQVCAWTGNRLETLTMDPDGFRHAARNGEPLIAELLAGARLLYGPTVGSMAGAALRPVKPR